MPTMSKMLISFVRLAFVISLFGSQYGYPQQTPSCTCQRKSVHDLMIFSGMNGAQLRAECLCPDADSPIPEAFWNYAALEVGYEQRVVLSNGTFVDSTFPELLYLALSGIQYLEPGAFLSLETVPNLYLKRNFMNILESNAFAHLEGLLTLDAGDGNLYAVNNGTFLGLSKLQTMSLRNNSIFNISRDSFLGLRVLTKLDLSDNNIMHLYAETFVHTPILREVLLQNNNIGLVERSVFVNLPNLVTVNLEYNRINGLPEPQNVSSIEPYWHRTTVLLHDNPLRCDCHMNWASFWADQEAKHVSGKCYFPPDFRGRTLTSFYDNPGGLSWCHANGTDVTAMEGSHFELTCPIENAFWSTPKGLELQEHGEHQDNFYLTNHDSLFIWNTRKQHAGMYVCRSKDGVERMEYRLVVQPQHYTIHLTVNQWIAIGFSGLVLVALGAVLTVIVVRSHHGNGRGQRKGYQGIAQEQGLPDRVIEDHEQPQPQPQFSGIFVEKDLSEKNVADLRSPDIRSNDAPSLEKYNHVHVNVKSSVTSNNIVD